MTTSLSIGFGVVTCVTLVSALACSDVATPDDVGNPSQAGTAGVGAGATGGGAGAMQPPGGGSAAAGSSSTAGGASAGGGSMSSGGAVAAGGAGASAGSSNASGGTGGASASGGTGGAGTGGSSTGGSGAGGTSGGGGTKPSMGCEKAASIALNQWVQSAVMTGGASRPYSVRLPSNYDPKRAYPVIMLLHGCGGGTNNVPMEQATGADAILVRGTGSAPSTCWDTKANGPDVAFFDAMVADVKARFCADEKRIFAVGYSSGSWLANQLTCIRADVLRGAATVTGGEAASGGCGGPVARIFIHDDTDNDNVIAGSENARDRQLTQNSCDKAAAPKPVDPSPCQLYQGCAAGYPVEWCKTTGKGHGRQDSFAPTTFWNFFKSL